MLVLSLWSWALFKTRSRTEEEQDFSKRSPGQRAQHYRLRLRAKSMPLGLVHKACAILGKRVRKRHPARG